MKQLDLFEKSKIIKKPKTKYKHHDWTNVKPGNLRGLANDDQKQYYHFPSLVINCKCAKDVKVYYRPKKPELEYYSRPMMPVNSSFNISF